MILVSTWIIRRCLEALLDEFDPDLQLCNLLEPIEATALPIIEPVYCLTFNYICKANSCKRYIEVVLLLGPMILVKAKKEEPELHGVS